MMMMIYILTTLFAISLLVSKLYHFARAMLSQHGICYSHVSESLSVSSQYCIKTAVTYRPRSTPQTPYSVLL